MPSTNGRLVRFHGFTPAEIMLGFVPEWKVTHGDAQGVMPDTRHETMREATRGEVKEMDESPEELRIEKMIEEKEEQRALAVQLVSENLTRQEGNTQAQWTQPRVGDLVLVRDFEGDKHHGRKLDAHWIGPRILTEITSSGLSGFVQELYGEEVKKYHVDDLKTYCPRAENSPTVTSITRTTMALAGFPRQSATTIHSLFFYF